ncbi:MAG: T9SS type A sorting domain-containing protein [Flavobacteriales bacterium]|nr:T9SS type A sorting domain-containing protein [Flavobacteriales bacterium]
MGVQANLLDAQLAFVAGPFMFGGNTAAQNLAAGHYVVERYWFNLLYPGCVDTIGFDVPDLGPACGTVSGSMYFDHDQDCVQDPNDPGMPYRVLTIQPAGEYAITDADGSYEHGLPYGNFNIEQPADDIVQLCPANNPEAFTIDNLNPAAIIDFADSSTIALDVSAELFSNAARPGFIFTYFGRANNLSGQQSGVLDIVLTFDPLLTFVSAVPVPSTTTANSVTWTGLTALSGFGEANVSVQLAVPPNPGLLGTALSATLDVSQPLTESTLVNNSDTRAQLITGSYDPNDKTAITSSNTSTTEYFILLDEYIDYVIRFQNTGTDTAFTVVITDTLSGELDMASFQQGLASHPFTVSFKPDRVAEWRFENILLPDSNTNEAASHGLVTFRIQPQQPLVAGTVISNAADIYFDFNPPVRTPPAVLIAQSPMAIADTGSDATLLLYPQPASDRVFVQGALANCTYQLLQTDGRLIRSGPLDENGIDLSGLSAATYLVVVIDPHGGADHARFVKH